MTQQHLTDIVHMYPEIEITDQEYIIAIKPYFLAAVVFLPQNYCIKFLLFESFLSEVIGIPALAYIPLSQP